MSKTKTFILLMVTGVLLLALFIGISFGWLYFGDDIFGIKLSVAKIDSSVVMYLANDTNKNGVPDLLLAPKDNRYYKERFDFSKKTDEVFALSEDTAANTLSQISLDSVFPSEVYTFKYELTNRSTADNRITFFLNEKEVTPETAAFLSTLSVRLGVVRSLDSENIAEIEFGEKIYLADYISADSFIGANISAFGSDIYIGGMTGMESSDNYLDFWLQIEMEDYDTLKGASQKFSLTEEEYNSLQGTSASLPTIYIYFEIVYENE